MSKTLHTNQNRSVSINRLRITLIRILTKININILRYVLNVYMCIIKKEKIEKETKQRGKENFWQHGV